MTETEASESAPGPKDNGYTPGDSFSTYWSNVFSYLSGKMTPEGTNQFRTDKDIRNEAADCKRCEDQRDYLLQYSPVIRFLSSSIRDLGGDLHSHNIYCRRCDQRQAGSFDPEYGIRICANEMRDRGHLEDTMAHEMVHAYDQLRFKLDWAGGDLRHAACSEIRAASLSGECRWAREFFQRGGWKPSQWRLSQGHQDCVRRRAALSVKARPACKDDVHAARVVNEVWESCFRDTRPFDEIYR